MKTKITAIVLIITSLLTLLSSCGVIYRVEKNSDSADNQGTENNSEIQTESETEAKSKDVRLSFVAAGDNMNHMSVYKEAYALAGGNGGYYYDSMYENVADFIKSADIAFVNQESPIAGQGYPVSGFPGFNAPEESGKVLLDIGFDIINLANNHMFDMDGGNKTGYLNSIKFWKNLNTFLIGGYESQADYDNVRVYEKDGVSIAFLSYTEFTNKNVNSDSGCIAPVFDKEVFIKHMAAAKEKADLVFVSMHWGDEGTFSPNSKQKELAQFISNQGADVIIGHHSHTIQPIKWLNGESGNKTLVIYSLGNFICTMLYPYNILGAIVGFDVVKNDGEKAYIDNVKFNPIVIHYNADASVMDEQDLPKRTGIKLYWLEDYTDSLAKSHGAQLYQNFNLDTLKSYCTSTIDSEFLPDYLK